MLICHDDAIDMVSVLTSRSVSYRWPHVTDFSQVGCILLHGCPASGSDFEEEGELLGEKLMCVCVVAADE